MREAHGRAERTTKRPPRPRVGWREWVALPDLGISAIKAKIDTGARSSSLHAYDVEIIPGGSGDRVRFKVHPMQRNKQRSIVAEGRLIDRRQVRSSSGHASHRIVVVTTLRLADQEWPIELTLTNRDSMGFRMLLGRQAIRRRFLVDPGRSYLVSERPRRKLRRKGGSQ